MPEHAPPMFRKATDFDLLFACSACKAAIQKDRRTRNVVRWRCDKCRLLFAPFLDGLYVIESIHSEALRNRLK